MPLKLDGHSFFAGLAHLRSKRKLPAATIKACPHEVGKVAKVACGEIRINVPIFDRRVKQLVS